MGPTIVNLFSGGMDSVATAMVFPCDLLLHIQIGTTDNVWETERVRGIAKSLGRPLEIVSLDLSRWELPNKIIPFRNHMLVLTAAQYGNTIHMGATAGDTTRDKDFHFVSDMEQALNYFGSGPTEKRPPHGEPDYHVSLPFRTRTKGEIAQIVDRDTEYSALELLSWSRSCYEGAQDKECGQCRACLRKYVAMRAVLGHHHVADHFQNDPRSFLPQMIEESERKGRCGREITELKLAAEGAAAK